MIAAVTGARGLIGRYIVEALLAKGMHVRVLSRSAKGMPNHQNLEVVVADINEKPVIETFLSGADSVFHCAAELNDESKMESVNVFGTSCLLDMLSLSPSVKYFCYLSSAGVLGPTSDAEVDESASCHPNSMYERTKYEAEKIVFQAGLDMSVCILRPANVFDASKPGIVGLGSRNSLRDKLSVFVKGNEGAHLVHAKDVASAAIFFMTQKLDKPEVFFVSYDNDKRNTSQGVFKLCLSMLRKSERFSLPSLPNEIAYFLRKIIKGRSLHGRVRFSGAKLRNAGFIFPLGFENGIMDVCSSVTSETL